MVAADAGPTLIQLSEAVGFSGHAVRVLEPEAGPGIHTPGSRSTKSNSG